MIENPGGNDNIPLGPVIVLKDGKLKSLDELLEATEGAQEILVSQLTAGDTLIMQSLDEHGNRQKMTIDIERAVLQDLGLSNAFAPSKSLSGTVSIHSSGRRVFTRNAVVLGSSFGGSMMSPGILRAGENITFWSREHGRWNSPEIQRMNVIRKKDSQYPQILDTEKLMVPDRDIVEKHAARMNQFKALMDKFGFSKKFDFTDGARASYSTEQVDFSSPTPPRDEPNVYIEGPLIATYDAGMATGNRLIMYNSVTGDYVYYKYYNFKGEDVLQVAYANVKGTNFNPREFGILSLESNHVHSADVAITTHNSSPISNLLATNYKPSLEEARDLLKIPTMGPDSTHVPRPDIQIEGESTLVVNKYPLAVLTEKDPGLLPSIQSQVSTIHAPNDAITLKLGSKETKLLSPDEIFAKVSR